MAGEKVLSSEKIYGRINRKREIYLGTSFVLLGVLFLLDIVTGSSNLTINEVFKTILAGPEQKGVLTSIIWDIRLPMTLICFTVGASLGLAGAQVQTILANPLASPYTLGLSSAAGFGAAIAFITGLPFPDGLWFNVPFVSFLSTMIGVFAIYIIGRVQGMQTRSMVLFGIVIHFFFQALLALVQFSSTPEVSGQIVFWMYGSLLKSTWMGVYVSGFFLIVCSFFLSKYAWKLTAIAAGEERAQTLGVDTDRVRIHIFIISAFLTAGAVSFVGTIGFIGLVAPHFARFFVGEDHRYLLPMSALCGAILITGASIVGKSIVPGIIVPIGIVTSLVGVPFLIYFIVGRKV